MSFPECLHEHSRLLLPISYDIRHSRFWQGNNTTFQSRISRETIDLCSLATAKLNKQLIKVLSFLLFLLEVVIIIPKQNELS